jgi:hypothetical protein
LTRHALTASKSDAEEIPAGPVLSGIQTQMDIYTSLAAAAGEPDIAKKVLEERHHPFDGVNNLDYWIGITDESAGNHFSITTSQVSRRSVTTSGSCTLRPVACLSR